MTMIVSIAIADGKIESYEGECNDCGCYLAKKGHEEANDIICMMPSWLKIALMKLKGISI